MASWQARAARYFIRKRVRPAFGDMRDLMRVRKVMGEQGSFTAEDVEQVFTRVFDAVGYGRAIGRDVLADVVLVRELVHHGRIARVWV